VLSLHEISALLLVQRSPGLKPRSKIDFEFLIAAGLMEHIPPSDLRLGVRLTAKGHDTLRRLETLGNARANGNDLLRDQQAIRNNATKSSDRY
jgi:hypothetical protein